MGDGFNWHKKLSRPGLAVTTSKESSNNFHSDPSKGSHSTSSLSLASPHDKTTLVHSQSSEVGGNICLPEG